MRAEQILPDAIDRADVNGVSVRKGTVAAFLANARIYLEPAASAAARDEAIRDLLEALPALRALGIFDVVQIRDEGLRAFVEAHH